MKCHCVKYYIIFLLFVYITVQGQDISDSTSFNINYFKSHALSIGLDKQLNTYLFTNYFKYGISGENIFAGVKEIFNSTIINASQKNIKDEQNLYFIGGYKFSPVLTAGLTINNISFSDDRYTQINKTALVSSLLYLQYNPLKSISFSPYVGISSNQQISQTDKGIVYGSDLSVNSLMISDFELNSQLRFQNEDISPRKNLLRNAAVSLTNLFEDSFTNTLSASFSEQKKDFYFTADPATALEYSIANNIQSRTETNYVIQNRFRSLPVMYGLSVDLLGSLYWRTIDRNTRYNSSNSSANSNYDTQINELKIDLTGGMDYRSASFFSSLRFSYSQYEEKHEAKRIEGTDFLVYSDREKVEFKKNNQAETATLSLMTNWFISDTDNIIFSIFHRKLKYDTPSSENYDDRDELLTIGRLGYERKFSPLFKLNVNLEGSLNKIVYIFSERSSNNSIRRFIKFSTAGSFSGYNFSSMNSAEVSANYTTFDYEYLNPSLRSYSFRQFILKDSSSLKVTNKIKFVINGYIKLSEQGDFSWTSFTERPARYLNEKLIEPKIGYFTSPFTLLWGIRYFNLSIYNVNSQNERVLNSEYQSIGPISEIKYKISAKIDLNFFGWYEFISGDNTKREVPNVIFKLNWNI